MQSRSGVLPASRSPEDTKQPDGSILRRASFVGIIVADPAVPLRLRQTPMHRHYSNLRRWRTRAWPRLLRSWSTKGDRASFTYVGEGGAGQFTYFDGTG